MKRLAIVGCLILAACGGPVQADKQVIITPIATVEDCNVYKTSDGEKLVICKTSNPALVRN